jgi:hypothetical protein
MTCLQGRASILSATCLLAALIASPLARAVDVTYDGANGGFWSDNVNWSNDVNGEPLAEFGEQAIINNGATVVVNTDQSGFSTSTGGVLLGVSGSTGGLDIVSGGNLTIRLSEFDFNNLQLPGNLEIGRAGRGYVTVQGGGTLTAEHILLGGATTAPESKLQVGNTSGLTATVTSNGETSLRRTTEIIGPNVNFTSKGPVTLASTSTLIANITGATHSPIKAVASPVTPTTTNATGHAYVDGALEVTATGATTLGQSWNIIEATTAIHGNFSSIDDSGVTLPAGGKRIQTRIVNGGIGKQLQAVVEQMLTLQVNRDSGAVAIRNTSPVAGGLNNVAITGYEIRSQHGSLNGASWSSLVDQAVAGWNETTPTANTIAELKSTAGGTPVNGNTSRALGAIFDQAFPAFGESLNDDITFQYTTSDGVRQGLIELTGQEVFNNLIVRVDPTTGMAQLRNDSPHTIAIEGYSIFSPTNQLNVAGWSSLDDQNVSPNVVEAAPTAGVLSELVTDGTITLNGFQTYSLGTIHPVAGTQNLTFEFLMDGAPDSQDGVVSYGPLYVVGPSADADFDNDNDVDGNDFLIWQRGVGVGNSNATGDADGNGIVNGADLTAWRSEFGPASTAAAGAIPEPSTALLAVLAGGIFWRRARRERGMADEASAVTSDWQKRSVGMFRSPSRTGLISAIAVLMTVCGMTASKVQAADILLITRPAEFGAPDDQLITLLKSFGHTIVNEGDIRLDQADYRAVPPTAAELTNVDAIVLSRANNSGNFDDSPEEIAGWNAITKPIISMNPQLARGGSMAGDPPAPNLGNNRWGWVNMDTTTTVDNQPASTSYDPFPNPAHPFVAGRSTDVFFNGETIDYINRDGTAYPPQATVVANMTIGVNITAAIVDIPTGATLFTNGQGEINPLGGRRVLLQMIEYPDTHDVFRMTTNGGQILNQIINTVTMNAGSMIAGDVDGNGSVNIADFNVIRNNYGMTVDNRNQGDLSGDSLVSLADLRLWKAVAAPADIAAAVIPEPASVALVLSGVAAVLAMRRRS